jgi:CrcB protein
VRLPVRPAWLAVILAGGTLGTGARAWLETAFPAKAGQWPWTTFWINVSGALLLGVLLALLAESGPDVGWRRALRLGVGTGVLGGYTTYSTFAVETLQLLRSGAWLAGLGYAVASVLLGLAAAYTGARVVRLATRRRRQRGRAS